MEARPATPSGTQEARFLLDTNICIYIRRKKPEEVLRRFRMLKQGEAALSVITFGEFVYGAEKSAQRAAAEAYGTMRAELERKGQMIGNNDLWIAAHAKASGLTLVTNNEREFRRVRGLKVENWAV